MVKFNPIQSWKEMPKAKKVATVAGTVAAAGAVAATGVALAKGKNIQLDTFNKAAEEGVKFKLNVGQALKDGFAAIGKEFADSKAVTSVKEFFGNLFHKAENK